MRTERARLDADRTAKPKTIIVGLISRGREGTCFAMPGSIHVDLETGKRTALLDQSLDQNLDQSDPFGPDLTLRSQPNTGISQTEV